MLTTNRICMWQAQPRLSGIDWDGPLPFDSSSNVVDVDPPDVPLSDADYEELVTTLNPLEPSAEYGLDLYCETLHFVLSNVITDSSKIEFNSCHTPRMHTLNTALTDNMR